jgi:hypothetical protein
MNTWAAFETAAPELAALAQTRFASRVAYLATIRTDGSPRLHPITPIIGGGHLYLYMEPTSPKGNDLRRDPRFALHCAVEDGNGGGGEFLINGQALAITAPEQRITYDSYASYKPKAHYILFELLIERASAITYEDDSTIHRRWP